MTNNEVVELWLQDEEGKAENLETDGNRLYSYDLEIGYTDPSGEKYFYNYTGHYDSNRFGKLVTPHFVTRTTSRHIGLIREKRIAYVVSA